MQTPYAPYVEPAPGVPARFAPGPAEPRVPSVMEALRFSTSDEAWKTNWLFALVLLVIPIVGPITLGGWFCEIMQRLARGHPRPMGKFDFSDFMHYLPRGLTPFLVSLVVTLPAMIVLYGMIGAGVVGAMAVASATGEPAVGVVIGLAVAIVMLVVGLFLGVIMNAAMTRAELTEDFGKSLSLGAILAYTRATAGRVIVKHLIFGLVALGLVIAGLLACYFGIYAAAIALQFAQVHLRWQIYSEYLAKGGAPIETKPPAQLPSEARAQGWGQYPPR